jgi:signal transduction histidine kinase
MLSLSYKNRIALNYIVSTAFLISLVFYVIYQFINYSVNIHNNDYIQIEVNKHLEQIEIDKNNSYPIQVGQWREIENNTVNVNSVFVQFLDINNKLIDKSPNLKALHLKLYNSKFDNQFIDTYLNEKPIRQIQVPLLGNKKIVGRLFIAISLDEATMILKNLRETLYIIFPLILILLFFIARFIAGRSIQPVKMITETSSKITRDNLRDRIILPENKDELFVLSKTINDLLDRIESAVEREKQFTSDASHELRTPLAVIKGTLEVLVRKPRNQIEYEDKINICINEVNQLNHLVDQLLLLARFENQYQSLKKENVYLNAIILDVISRHSSSIFSKKITVNSKFSEDFYVVTDGYLFAIIINNLISNALKYSKDNTFLTINLTNNQGKMECTITDTGIGIQTEDLQRIFDQFYRSKSNDHPEIKGTGLGLSIVKRLCSLLHIDIKIFSQENSGTTIKLRFL